MRYLLAFEEGKKAEAQIRPAFEAAERAYGSRSIHVFQWEYWLAYTLYKQGKGAEGMAMLDRAVTRAREYLRPDHSFLLRAQLLLARLFQLAGRSQPSWTLLEAVINVQTRTLPPGDPALMEARQDYSLALTLQRKAKEDLMLAKATLDDCKKYLSTEHVLTCAAAFVYANLGFPMRVYEGVDRELPQAIKTLEYVLGHDLRDTRTWKDSQQKLQ